MFAWLTRRGLKARMSLLRIAPRVVQAGLPTAGEYQSLYKYLRDRHANRVVLTFGEIEDLLGFSLPDPARVQFAWWTAVAAAPSTQSLAWTLAGRTAAVNLPARRVTFDRDERP